jgi:hypothetical protein
VLPPNDEASVVGLEGASRVERGTAARAYTEALAGSPFVRGLLAGQLPYEWAVTFMVSDDPAKGLGRAANDALLWPHLERILGMPTRGSQLVSPYFVPGRTGFKFPDPTGLQVLKCRVSGRRHSCHPSPYHGRGCENGRSTEDPARPS